MKIHRRLLVRGIAVLLAIAVSIQPASAWNDRGHMSVGYVAYKRLNLATRNRVNALLKLNPKYNDWAAKVEQQMPNASPDDKNLMIFMLATTWADEIKRDHAYKQDGTQGGNRPDGSPDPGRNTGYDDLLMHKYWHFIDTPFSTAGTPLPPIPTPNAQERIALFRNVLASSSPDELKSYDLVWLLHIVGDIHQPLHASTRVSQPDPDGDAGGNLVKLDCAKCELHFFWDDLLGTQNDLKTVVKGARKLPKPPGALVAKTDEKDWIAESFQEAQQVVYAPPVGPGNGPYTLTIEYKKSAGKLAKQRVALAGARLAKLLNDELK
ncbi:MAG TPA: S1/P1 nuclease [Candidatus Acidoferrum sp.]|nr:S1/P1 nuclease [Candidatus Acidoferrum sp.]